MSVFTAGASDTNAKLVRSLAHSLKTSSANCKPLLDHCRSQNAFSAISANDTEHFFNTVTGTLTSANERTASLSLQVLYHALSSIPPYLVCPHWLQTAQKLTSLLKSSKSSQNPRFQAKLLTAMASVVTSAAPFPVLQPEMKPVVSKICQSALYHALRALEPTHVTDYMCKAALCLIFAVLSTAPREVRTILSQLEAGIRQLFLFHRNASIRNTAVLLSAHLLVCHAEKTRIKVFEERLNDACEQLHEIMNMIDMYAPSDGEKRQYAFNEALQKLSLHELQFRVTTACSYIRHAVELQLDMLMPMPLAALYRALLRGIEDRCVDAYATQGGTPLLDTDSVFLLINTLMVECAETLVSVTEACGKDATIVFTHQIGQCLQTKLSHVVLRSRTEVGVSSNLCERRSMYRMLAGMTEVLGCGLIEYVSGMLEELFSIEVKLHVACAGRNALLGKGQNDVTDGNNRSRKRRRYQNEEGRQKGVSKSKGLLSKATPMNSLDKYSARNVYSSKQTVQEALKCVIVVFEHRGYISARVSEHLRKMEQGIMKVLREGVMFEDVVHAASAAGLSGGCNRMYGEASELLLVGSRICRDGLTGSGDARSQREARRSRSAFESIVHARGPAFCMGKRLCGEAMEQKLIVNGSGNELAEAIDVEGDGREKDIAIARDVRDGGGDKAHNDESKDAHKVTESDGVSYDGKLKKMGEDVDMMMADDGALDVMDGRGGTREKNVRSEQGSMHEHEGNTRDNDTNAGDGENGDGQQTRERVTTTNVTARGTEGQGVPNKWSDIDLHAQSALGEARDGGARDGGADDANARDDAGGEEGAMAVDGPKDSQQPDASHDDASHDDASHDDASHDDASRLARGGGADAPAHGASAAVDEEEDEEALIQSLNFAPPDARQ